MREGGDAQNTKTEKKSAMQIVSDLVEALQQMENFNKVDELIKNAQDKLNDFNERKWDVEKEDLSRNINFRNAMRIIELSKAGAVMGKEQVEADLQLVGTVETEIGNYLTGRILNEEQEEKINVLKERAKAILETESKIVSIDINAQMPDILRAEAVQILVNGVDSAAILNKTQFVFNKDKFKESYEKIFGDPGKGMEALLGIGQNVVKILNENYKNKSFVLVEGKEGKQVMELVQGAKAESLTKAIGTMLVASESKNKDPQIVGLWQKFKDWVNDVLESLGFKVVDVERKQAKVQSEVKSWVTKVSKEASTEIRR
ncbi:hypothetical protein MIDIC_480009 [Alphaproteobacteria bacterium]